MGTQGPHDPVAILRFFDDNCRSLARMERNRELERRLVLRSKVELALLASLTSRSSALWKETLKDDGNKCAVTVRLGNPFVCPNSPQGPAKCKYQHAPNRPPCADSLVTTHKQRAVPVEGGFPSEDRENRTPYYLNAPVEVVLSLGGDCGFPLGTVIRALPQGIEDTSQPPGKPASRILHRRLGETCSELQHGDEHDLSWRLYERYTEVLLSMPRQLTEPGCIAECMEKFADRASTVKSHGTPLGIGATLLHLLCLLHEFKSEDDGIDYVTNCLGISDRLYSVKGWLDGRRGWRQHPEMHPMGSGGPAESPGAQPWSVDLYNAKGFIAEAVHIDPGNGLLLPVTAWTQENAGFRHYLNLPARQPLLLSLPAIRGNPEATVILTSAVEIAVANARTADPAKAVWTSWYGEAEAVPFVDWGCLRGREVLYVVVPDPRCPSESAYTADYGTAHAVLEQLQEIWGISLHFVVAGVEGCQEGADPREGTTVWSPADFAQEYRRTRALEARSTAPGKLAPRSMKQIVAEQPQELPFLLSPILTERSTSMMYSRTNLGKTWLALCMGAAIAHGTSLFDGRWQAGRPRKVLYIDSEMDEQSMRVRIDIVSRMVFDKVKLPYRHHKNFLCVSRSRATPGVEAFKNEVVDYVRKESVALVILDNLTSFTQHNDSAKAWEDIHVWIDRLKSVGCSSLIIHHENKLGGQRGTSATTNAVDNVLHLVDPDDPKEKRKSKGTKKRGMSDEEDGNGKESEDVNGHPKVGQSWSVQSGPSLETRSWVHHTGSHPLTSGLLMAVTGMTLCPTSPLQCDQRWPTSGDRCHEDGRENQKGKGVPLQSQGGLVLKVKVEKGRCIYGDARAPFIARILPNTTPPICIREELPEDDIDHPIDTSEHGGEEAKHGTKRAYRKSDEQKEELRESALGGLAKGQSVTEVAAAMDVSRAHLYRVLGVEDEAAIKAAAEQRAKFRAERGERVFAMAEAGTGLAEIAKQERISLSAVRRLVDKGWTDRIKARCSSLPQDCPANTVADIIGCEETTAARLLVVLRLQAAPRYREEGLTFEEIAEKLKVDLSLVEKACRRVDQRKQEAQTREHELAKVRQLHADGKKAKEIQGAVDLPRQVVNREIARLEKTEANCGDTQ